MLRTLLVTIVFLTLPLLVQAQLRVGVMDPDAVIDALPETAQVQQQLQQYVNERQEEYVNQYSSFVEDVGNFEELAESGALSDTELQQREQELGEREQELEALGTSIQNQIQTRQNELLAPIMERVEVAMGAVSEEMGLDYVLNRLTGRGEPIVYYVSERGVDITEQVIQRLTE
ncbi:MAG: OmpH family outer membrane protein [Balneolaceae bacterium]